MSAEELMIACAIKRYRVNKGLTLDELSEKTGLTKGQLSKIENCKASPPIATLMKISRALDITLSDLFANTASKCSSVLIKKGEGTVVTPENNGPGYIYEQLANGYHPRKMEPFVITVEDTGKPVKLFDHEGEEFIFVLQGQLEYIHGKDIYLMDEGDALYFDSSIPHGPKPVKGKTAKFIAVFLN